VAGLFAELLSAAGARAGHNLMSLTAHDALRMGPTKFSGQLAALTGSKATVGPPPGKRVGSAVEVEQGGNWYATGGG
jgi:hypothetical protein